MGKGEFMDQKTEVAQQAASIVAWLDHVSCQRLMRMLLHESFEEAGTFLSALFTDLPDDLDLRDAGWTDAILDALEGRISPPDDDFDRAPTDLVPNYARYAQDVRSL